MSPSGPAQIAGIALAAGHRVRVYDCLVDPDTRHLEGMLKEEDPDVVAVSIPMVTGHIPDESIGFPKGFDNAHPKIKAVTDILRRRSNAVIVAGGAGFSYFPRNWLMYLNLEYGLVGDADVAFPMFLSRCFDEAALRQVPGIIIRSGETYFVSSPRKKADLNEKALPAYHLFDTEYYNKANIPWGIITKRLCAHRCRYCSSHRMGLDPVLCLKSLDRIRTEIQHVKESTGSDALIFCDTCFNRPIAHTRQILLDLVRSQASVRWRAGTFKPLGFSTAFCRLLETSGCTYVGLAMETASPRMLANLNLGYRMDDIRLTLDRLSETQVDFGVSLLMGAPGETLVSIRETLAVLDAYPRIKAVWVNVGIFGHRQGGKSGLGTFQNTHYISPELREDDMLDLIDELSLRENYLIQVNKPWADYQPRG